MFYCKDLFDKEKNPGFKLSVKSILNNKKIRKDVINETHTKRKLGNKRGVA
jgi:hypothetical protein